MIPRGLHSKSSTNGNSNVHVVRSTGSSVPAKKSVSSTYSKEFQQNIREVWKQSCVRMTDRSTQDYASTNRTVATKVPVPSCHVMHIMEATNRCVIELDVPAGLTQRRQIVLSGRSRFQCFRHYCNPPTPDQPNRLHPKLRTLSHSLPIRVEPQEHHCMLSMPPVPHRGSQLGSRTVVMQRRGSDKIVDTAGYEMARLD